MESKEQQKTEQLQLMIRARAYQLLRGCDLSLCTRCLQFLSHRLPLSVDSGFCSCSQPDRATVWTRPDLCLFYSVKQLSPYDKTIEVSERNLKLASCYEIGGPFFPINSGKVLFTVEGGVEGPGQEQPKESEGPTWTSEPDTSKRVVQPPKTGPMVGGIIEEGGGDCDSGGSGESGPGEPKLKHVV